MTNIHILIHCITLVAMAFMYHGYLKGCCENSDNERRDKGDVTTTCGLSSSMEKVKYSSGNGLLNKVQSHSEDTADKVLKHIKNLHGENLTPNTEKMSSLYDNDLRNFGSSVWCHGENHTVRVCHFKNLCYFPSVKSFIFLHSNKSIMSGVPENRFGPALLDMSGVWDHNAMYFNYIDAPLEALADKQIKMIAVKSLMLKRFNVDNIMHVFHDDLLPIYHTLLMIDQDYSPEDTSVKPFNVQLIFMDGSLESEYTSLYNLLTVHKPLTEADLNNSREIVCIRDLHVGLTKMSTWYQYGFKRPQGPLHNMMVTSAEIRHFTEYLKRNLGIKSESGSAVKEPWITLLTRKHNRKIVNEVDLTLALAGELNMKVMICSSETHSVAELIQWISGASILIGVHGSLMSYAIFLKPGSLLVELFPYAINPENYTPYKTLSLIPGMGIIYKAWRNMDRKKSIPHPDGPSQLGGISHLQTEEQERIKSSTEVPDHLCCNNPEWLYRIYQDTVVDIQAVIDLIKDGLHERSESVLKNKHQSYEQRMFPSEVRNISCTHIQAGVSYLVISWEPPWNTGFFQKNLIQYEVWIQPAGLSDYAAWILSSTSHKFTEGISADVTYHIWVRCLVGDHRIGPFNSKISVCLTS